MADQNIEAVRSVLGQFQDGYTRREVASLEAFRELFDSDAGVEVIGTGGVTPGEDEWCLGLDAAMTLVQNDWEGWGDLRLDIPGARIHTLGDVAWLATTGTVQIELKRDGVYTNYLESLHEILDNQEVDARSRLIEILRGGTNTLFEGERGDAYVWPIRFSAVLVRREDRWRFHQVQYSFATTRFPDVRS